MTEPLTSGMPASTNYPDTMNIVATAAPAAEGQRDGTYTSASWQSPPPVSPKSPRRLRKFTRAQLILFFVFLGLRVSIVLYRVFHDRSQSHTPVWHHSGEIARADQLHGTGRIYLVQLGKHTDPYTVVDLATWLREKYSLDTQVLETASLDPAAWDSSRRLYVAELLNDQIKREHPALAQDPNAWLIGFTDAKIYSVAYKWSSLFTLRDEHRAAIISSSGIGYPKTQDSSPETLFRDRMRRILLKDVATLFWHLPLNNDPGSVLQTVLNPNIPTNDLYQSDLGPIHSQWGESLGDPCIVFTFAAGKEVKSAPPSSGAVIRECRNPENVTWPQSKLDTPDEPPDTGQERIELRLHYGLLTEKHTDFYLPGPVPIRFERATSNRWQMPMAFGVSGGHNYNRYLVSHDAMRHIDIANAGSGDATLARVPLWLSFLALINGSMTNRLAILRCAGGAAPRSTSTSPASTVRSKAICPAMTLLSVI